MHDRAEGKAGDGRVFSPSQLRLVGPNYYIEISSRNVVVFEAKIDMGRNTRLLQLKLLRTFENQLPLLSFLHALCLMLHMPCLAPA